jgi:hypothetical protein
MRGSLIPVTQPIKQSRIRKAALFGQQLFYQINFPV